MDIRACLAAAGHCTQDSCAFHPRILHMVSEGAWAVEDGTPATTQDYQKIFHTPCRTCEADVSWQDELCSRCVHLRVYHLTNCLQHITTENMPLIILGTLKELWKREKCKFCRMVANMFNTTKHDRLRDKYFEAPVLMLPRVGHLSIKYRREIISSKKGTPDLLFFTPREHNLNSFLQIGIERYAMVVTKENQHNTIKNLKLAPHSRIGGAVNWPKITDWVKQSLANRQDRTVGGTFRVSQLPRNFKLIDLRRGCITITPEEPVYVALSYVWGQKLPEEIETTLENIATLSEDGVLDKIELPETIRDAITFCRRFNILYLWVDRLCIVQDDATQKHDQIAAMNVIYSRAAFTICAAAGHNSRAGLPGVGHTRRLSRLDAQISNIEIMPILPDMGHSVNEGSWAERGWTYQESLLGGNLFIFTEYQAFYRGVDDTENHEDDLTDVGDANGWFEEATSIKEMEEVQDKSMFGFYADYLRGYSARKLSYASDTFHAFAGVHKYLYEDLDAYIYGLPEKDFDVAMVWMARPSPDLTPLTRIENIVLPTWSWGSLMHWTNEIRCGQYDLIASLARWARCEPTGKLKPIKATNDPTAHLIAYRWEPELDLVNQAIDPRPYVLAAWSICIEAPVPMIRKLRSPSRDALTKRWPTYTHFWKEAHSARIPLRPGDNLSTLNAKPGRIVVRTTVKRSRVWAGPTSGFAQDFYIIDDDDWCLGICRIPIAVAKANNLPLDMGVFDFLALSLRLSRDTDFFDHLKRKLPETWSEDCQSKGRRIPPPIPREVSPSIMAEDEDGNDLDESPVLNVMMIGWNGSVAHRICIGWASLARWKRTSPTFQTIVLE